MDIAHLFKLDSVKLALGGAQTAADAQVFVDLGCAAAEAAGCLLAYLFLCEGNAGVGEGLGLGLVVSGDLTVLVIEAADV